MDHSILILNAQAAKDLTAVDESATSNRAKKVSRRTIEVANRALGLLLTDQMMSEVSLGYHNNQYIMICHAATEILRVSSMSARRTVQS